MRSWVIIAFSRRHSGLSARCPTSIGVQRPHLDVLNSTSMNDDTFQTSPQNIVPSWVFALKAEFDFDDMRGQLSGAIDGPVQTKMGGEEAPHHRHNVRRTEEKSLAGAVGGCG